jgi:PAS domain S-box-containing protein/putative nucleotidyltransferase with HDIG domain
MLIAVKTEPLTNLRALIIEDNPVDTEMFGSILRNAGYKVTWNRIATESEYVSSLGNSPDIIIADYSSPQFDVSRALQILKEKGSDTPFIMITGTICETMAIDCMQKGASDYLFRDRLARLGYSVAQALSNNGAESGREKADEILKRSEERYKNIIDNIHEGYFEVDLAGSFTFFNDSLCRILGYPRHELMGMNNRAYTTPKTARKIYRIYNEMYRKGTACDFYDYEITRKDGSRSVLEISTSPLRGGSGVIVGFQGIVRDVTKHRRAEEELQKSFSTLHKTLEDTIDALGFALQTKDPFTAGHQRRVAELSSRIAEEMNYNKDGIRGIRLAALVHDIGKIHVPTEILSKPGQLTDVEFDIIKTHSQAGYDIIKSIEFPWPIATIVLQHHERLDGSGYPLSLKENEILKEAKIMAVADVVESISSDRPYRPALGIDVALDEISGKKGILYDPEAAEICIKLFKEGSFRFTS